MAQITKYPFIRHIRSEPTSHVLRFHRGDLVASGRGLSFWYMPLETSIMEIPIEDRELPFLFHGRSRDFQDVAVQGVVTFRVIDAVKLAERVDFTIDLGSGKLREKPLDRLAGLITELAQQHSWGYLAKTNLEEILEGGFEAIRIRIDQCLRESPELSEMGLLIAAVRLTSLRPSADLEKALQTPTLERLQQQADEATFARRAQAVDKERAIEENELQNKIELSKREASLIEQKGANRRREAQEEAEASRIIAEGQAERRRVDARAEAEAIESVERARVEAESNRMEIYRQFPPEQLLGLAAQRLAGKLTKIDHVSLSPDSLTGLLSRLASAGAARLENQREG